MTSRGGDAGQRAAPPDVGRLADLVERARSLAALDRRTLLGLAGAPGAGKSTLSEAIVAAVGHTARRVGMDGFHLAQSRLAELGRLDRKGAIDTFDGAGFVALVRRLRDSQDEVIYAPEFQRELEESIAGAVGIEPDVRLVVVEGNYLLVADEPWGELRGLLDEVWYCERDEADRLATLIARHRAYGKSEEDARSWARGSDQRNTELILRTRSRADVIARLDGQFIDSSATRAREWTRSAR